MDGWMGDHAFLQSQRNFTHAFRTQRNDHSDEAPLMENCMQAAEREGTIEETKQQCRKLILAASFRIRERGHSHQVQEGNYTTEDAR